jgi:hypothetical protein
MSNAYKTIPLLRARKRPFLITVTKGGLHPSLTHTVYAYNLKYATKFAMDFIGDDYQSVTVEAKS